MQKRVLFVIVVALSKKNLECCRGRGREGSEEADIRGNSALTFIFQKILVVGGKRDEEMDLRLRQLLSGLFVNSRTISLIIDIKKKVRY